MANYLSNSTDLGDDRQRTDEPPLSVSSEPVPSSLNSKIDNEENHINIGKNLDQMTENNSDDHSCLLPTKTLSVNENCLLTETSEIRDGSVVQLSSASNTHKSTTENTNESIMMATVNNHNYTAHDVYVNYDNDYMFIESPSNSDELLINMAIKDPKKFCKSNFPAFIKLFTREDLSYEAFKKYFFQIFATYNTFMNDTGKLRKIIQLLTKREIKWEKKYMRVTNQIREMAAVAKEIRKNGLEAYASAKPNIITRTVGIQYSSELDSSMKLPSSLPPSRAKHFSRAIPILNVNDFTIDLTGPDNLHIPQTKLNVEKSLIKVIQSASHMESSSQPGTMPLTASVANSSTSNVTKTPLTTSIANLSTSDMMMTPVSPFVNKGLKLIPGKHEPPLSVSSEPVLVSPNKLTNAVKRPLPKDLVESDEIKKKKPTENDVNEKELGVFSSLNSKIDNEENHINIGKNRDQMTENNSDEHSCLLPTRTLSVNENCLLTETSEIIEGSVVQLSSASNTHKSTTENNNESIMMATVNNHNYTAQDVDVNYDNDCMFIESPSNSDKLLINMAIKDPKKFCKSNFPAFIKLFSRENMSYEEFESYFLQIFAENPIMNETYELANQIQLFTAREENWNQKYLPLIHEAKQLAAVIKIHKNGLKATGFVKPHIITRTVGIQVSVPTTGTIPLTASVANSSTSNETKTPLTTSVANSSTSDVTKTPLTTSVANSSTSDVTKTPLTTSVANSSTSDVTKTPLTTSVSNSSTSDVTKTPLITSVANSSTSDVTKTPLTTSVANSSTSNVTKTPLTTSVSNSSTSDVTKTPLTTSVANSSTSDVTKTPLTTSVANSSTSNVTKTPLTTSVSNSSTSDVTKTPLTASVANSSTSDVTKTPLTTSVSNSSISNVIMTPVSPFVYKRLKLIPVKLSLVTVQNQIQTSPVTSHQSLQPVLPSTPNVLTHPAPLPSPWNTSPWNSITWKKLPPVPVITLSKSFDSQKPKEFMLTWNLDINSTVARISRYHIFSYEVNSSVGLQTNPWIKIGDVEALPLPMACSITKFITGGIYFFAVRAMDKYNRLGPFSLPQSISL